MRDYPLNHEHTTNKTNWEFFSPETWNEKVRFTALVLFPITIAVFALAIIGIIIIIGIFVFSMPIVWPWSYGYYILYKGNRYEYDKFWDLH